MPTDAFVKALVPVQYAFDSFGLVAFDEASFKQIVSAVTQFETEVEV
jgi:hypothetical protein